MLNGLAFRHMCETPVRDRNRRRIVANAKIIVRRQRPISWASLTRVIERYHVPDASKRSRACFERVTLHRKRSLIRLPNRRHVPFHRTFNVK